MFILLMSVEAALGCTIIQPSLKDAVKNAEIVFRGTITEITDAEITFRVERVWKGHVPAVFPVPKMTWSSSPCLPGFYEGWVKVGTELLVYARRMPGDVGNRYVSLPGSRTMRAHDAAEDLKKLGAGRPAER